jgi:DNA polymerase-3 subunit delta'
MVSGQGALPLPWLAGMLDAVALAPRGHALLLHGPRGIGQFELAMLLAQSWLCEDRSRPNPAHACGRCAGCRLVQAKGHPDLLVLLPEALRESLGWALDDEEAETSTEGKRKPSREIKVDAARAAIAFAQRTATRGGAKVIVVHPADAMNATAANTLLKTLEEPPAELRFVLCSAAPDALPATVRSRCQPWRAPAPAAGEALAWLQEQSVPDAAVLLAAAGGEPLTALEWARDGIEGAAWQQLGDAVRRGDAALLARWPVPRALEALGKLCHDTLRVTLGLAPCWFDAARLAPARDLQAVLRWSQELARVERNAEHPWHGALLIETLVTQGRRALG